MTSKADSLEQERREVRTPDGRRVVFHVAGPEEGDLVVYHTGTPGTSYLYVDMIRQCVARGLRVACFARPGYGGSDRVPGRSYADNPADTAVVADGLGAETFFAIGYSGGGGPALADAALLGGRVRAAAVGSALAPRLPMGPSWRDDLDDANGEELEAIEAGETDLRNLLESWAERMRQVRSGEDIKDDFSRLYAAVDRACFKGEFLEWVVESSPMLVTPGVDGWIDDDFSFFGDWGFELSAIAVPVTIWHGGEDRIIPRAHAEFLCDNIPGARPGFKDEDGHISLIHRHFGAMLDDLIERGS